MTSLTGIKVVMFHLIGNLELSCPKCTVRTKEEIVVLSSALSRLSPGGMLGFQGPTHKEQLECV